MSVAVMVYAHMVGRLMQSALTDREHRPGCLCVLDAGVYNAGVSSSGEGVAGCSGCGSG